MYVVTACGDGATVFLLASSLCENVEAESSLPEETAVLQRSCESLI